MDQGFLVVQELYTGSVFNHIVSHRLLCFNVTQASTVEAQIQLNIKLFKRDGKLKQYRPYALLSHCRTIRWET
jgi:hypothetical protein